MAAPYLDLVVNVADPELQGLCALVGGNVVASPGKKLPKLIRNDGRPIRLRFVQPSAGNQVGFDEVDVSTASVRVAIGLPDQAPTGGTFVLQVGSTLTSDLPWNANAAQVGAALNLLPDIVSAGGVAVTSPGPGFYQVTWNTAGAQGTIPITLLRSSTPRIYLLPPTVTGYTGGGATKLDGQPTLGAALGSIFTLVVNGVQSAWQLQAGTAVSDPTNGVVRPTDYDAAANTVNLVRVQGL